MKVASSWLPASEINFIKRSSCSRRNFCANLVRRLFDENTRKNSNVSGRQGKAQLNPVIISFVKSAAFQYYPCDTIVDVSKEWGYCIIAIDESCRRLVNKPKKGS